MPIVLPRNAAKIVKLSSKLAAAEVAVVEAHEAKAAMDAAERSHKAEVREAKAKALADYQNSEEFTALLDKEVMGQCDDLVYRFKRYNADMKLSLNFLRDPSPLPQGVIEEMPLQLMPIPQMTLTRAVRRMRPCLHRLLSMPLQPMLTILPHSVTDCIE
ncbi:unnamed protein product [Prunus armeniaca]